MMANTSKKGGKLLVMSPDGPRADVSLLDSFIQGNVQNHMFGRDIPPWLPGSEDEEKAKSVGRTLTASVGTHQDRENNGGGTEAAFKGQDGRRRRGIHIPSPGDIEGPRTLPMPTLSLGNSNLGGARTAPVPHSKDGTVVHVFWDLENKHPGSMDPRILTHRIKAAAGSLGEVSGVYAYATRKVSNWVPDALFAIGRDALRELEAALEADRALLSKRSSRTEMPQGGDVDASRSAGTVANSKDTLSLLIAGKGLEAGRDGISSGPPVQGSSGSTIRRCPMCGSMRRSDADLEAHMKSVHGSGSGSESGGAGGRQRPSLRNSPPGSSGVLKGGDLRSAQISAPVNGPDRALGRILSYCTSSGRTFVPPPGHQLSLRYVLRCEGVDFRIAQNAKEDSGLALGAGMVKLAGQLSQQQQEVGNVEEDGTGAGEERARRQSNRVNGQQSSEGDKVPKAKGEVPGSLGAGQTVAMVVSDDVRLLPQLRALKASGFAIIIVSSDKALLKAKIEVGLSEGPLPQKVSDTKAQSMNGAGKRGTGIGAVADLILDWEAIREGMYQT